MKIKFKAFFIHLCVSMAIFCSFLAIMLIFWYPAPFFSICDGKTVLSILVITDVIIGPTITFIIYKPKKPWLVLDLSIIASIQILALAYGGSIIYSERPLFMVFAMDRFELVLASTPNVDLQKLSNQQILSSPYPQTVFAKPPSDQLKLAKIAAEYSINRKGLEAHPEYYEPTAAHIEYIFSKALSLDMLANKYPNNKQIANAMDRKHELKNNNKYFPAIVNSKPISVIFSTEGKIVDFIDAPPW